MFRPTSNVITATLPVGYRLALQRTRACRTITAGVPRQQKGRNHDRVAIHGFGRIGHSLMKAALEGDFFIPVSISDIKDVETLAALFEVDSNYGRWSEPVGSASLKGSPRLVIRSAASKTYTNLQAHSVKNRRFRKDHRT